MVDTLEVDHRRASNSSATESIELPRWVTGVRLFRPPVRPLVSSRSSRSELIARENEKQSAKESPTLDNRFHRTRLASSRSLTGYSVRWGAPTVSPGCRPAL